MTRKRMIWQTNSNVPPDPLIGYIPEQRVVSASSVLTKHSRKRHGGLFLKGPIKFDWIVKAIADPADRLALVIRAFMDIEGTSSLRVTSTICRHAGI